MLRKIALLGAATAVAGTALLAAPANAAGNCNGQYDYACTDRDGNFCTLYTGSRCTVGLPI